MAERPIIYIRSSGLSERTRSPGGPGRRLRFPDAARQYERISPRVRELEEFFARRTAQLSQSATGIVPEEVIVFEIAGTIERFVNAVLRIEGMEWLVESDEFGSDVDDDFGFEESGEPSYPTRLYFVVANQQALRQFLSLWERHRAIERGSGDTWPYGLAPVRDVFRHLKDVRPWGSRDRLLDTGLVEDWGDRLARGDDGFPVEVDLWFRNTSDRRETAENSVRQSIEASGGELLSRTIVPEIEYHGMLARFRADTAQRLIASEEVALVLSGPVMLLRPAGQFAAPPAAFTPADQQTSLAGGMLPQGSPRLALLDGSPLMRHELLSRRILLHDPDDFDALYGAGERKHGTAMASVIIHGDLGTPDTPLESPLIVRLIMRPDPRTENRDERMPEDVLAVDLVHRAVRELVDGGGLSEPVAPSVRLINLSIGDPNRPFDHVVTPMARLLDWLSWNYDLLFVVSAGNYTEDISLDVLRDDFENLPEGAKSRAIVAGIWRDARLRRVLSPAESVNAITVASTHQDGSRRAHPRATTFFDEDVFPSPLNPLGLGYGRAVKPDVLAAGGRQPYGWSFIQPADGTGLLRPLLGSYPPGIQVAGPGAAEGELTATNLHSWNKQCRSQCQPSR